MNGAQCGGPAELRAPFVLPRVAVGSAAGDLLAGGCPTGRPQPALEAAQPMFCPAALDTQVLSCRRAFAPAGPHLECHSPLRWLHLLPLLSPSGLD